MTSDSFSGDDDASRTFSSLAQQTRDLELGANSFAKAMTSAFATSVTGGKQFDDVLKSLTLRLSNISVNLALAPVTKSISTGIDKLLSGLTGSGNSSASVVPNALGSVKPFASGGGNRHADVFSHDDRWRWPRRRSGAGSDHAAHARP